MMLAEGKIQDTWTGGSESFRVSEQDYILKQKENVREIFSNGNNSEFSQDSSEEMETNLGIEERFRNIENQLAIILERLDKGVEENDNRDDMQGRPDKFCDMLAKINLQESEKRELKDENFALRLQI